MDLQEESPLPLSGNLLLIKFLKHWWTTEGYYCSRHASFCKYSFDSSNCFSGFSPYIIFQWQNSDSNGIKDCTHILSIRHKLNQNHTNAHWNRNDTNYTSKFDRKLQIKLWYRSYIKVWYISYITLSLIQNHKSKFGTDRTLKFDTDSTLKFDTNHTSSLRQITHQHTNQTSKLLAAISTVIINTMFDHYSDWMTTINVA